METRYLRSFGDLASANNPPKPLLTAESRQHTADERGGSFFRQNDSLVAISTDGFVVTQDAQEEVGNAACVDFVRLSERVLHLRIRHRFGIWISPSVVGQYLSEQQPLLVFGDIARFFQRQSRIWNGRPAGIHRITPKPSVRASVLGIGEGLDGEDQNWCDHQTRRLQKRCDEHWARSQSWHWLRHRHTA